MKSSPSRRSERGFTLLEMLVTLSLLCLLSLALFGSVRYGSRVWAASRTSAAQADAVRAAQAEVTAIVSAAYPQLTLTDPEHASIAFSGDASRLKVLAPDPRVAGALDEVTIRRVAREKGGALVVERRLELAANNREARVDVLLNGLTALRFDYFGPASDGGPPKWNSSWNGRRRPPTLVRVRAGFSDIRTEWPDLTVPPQIAADMSCKLSPSAAFCEGR